MQFYYKQEVLMLIIFFAIITILFGAGEGLLASLYLFIVFTMIITITCNYYSMGLYPDFIEVKRVYGKNIRVELSKIIEIRLVKYEEVLPILGEKKLLYIEVKDKTIKMNVESLYDLTFESALIKFCERHHISLFITNEEESL